MQLQPQSSYRVSGDPSLPINEQVVTFLSYRDATDIDPHTRARVRAGNGQIWDVFPVMLQRS